MAFNKTTFQTGDTLRAAFLNEFQDEVIDHAEKINAVNAVMSPQRDGKIYGVKRPNYPYSTSYVCTRTEAAVGMTAAASTNLVKNENDFDDVPMFQYERVNGYVRSDGEFVETAVFGDGNYATDGSNGDVWNRFQLSFFRYIIGENYTEIQVTDTPRVDGNGGWCPFGIFVRPDKSLKKYAYIPAYEAGYNDLDGKLASISGVQPAHGTYENRDSAEGSTTSAIKFGFSMALLLTEIRKKGAQYSGMTSRDYMFLQTLFIVEFATLNSQAIMVGCTDFDVQINISVATEDQEYVVVSNADAEKFPVGSAVSVGVMTGTSMSRNNASIHSTVLWKRITAKEAYDENNTIVHIDNGGDTFSTTTDMYLSSMPWYTGATDGVLGSSGSYIDNTSGKYPMMYRGVENLYGNLWTIMSDLIVSSYKPYICYDCTKYKTSVSGTDYQSLNYTVATKNGYARVMGYDENHPSVQMCITSGGQATQNYCDNHYTASGTAQEVLVGGVLNSTTNAGLFVWGSHDAVSHRTWSIAGRLSASGQSAAL